MTRGRHEFVIVWRKSKTGVTWQVGSKVNLTHHWSVSDWAILNPMVPGLHGQCESFLHLTVVRSRTGDDTGGWIQHQATIFVTSQYRVYDIIIAKRQIIVQGLDSPYLKSWFREEDEGMQPLRYYITSCRLLYAVECWNFFFKLVLIECIV